MSGTRPSRRRSGVTLVELLVVISIMLILMTIMASALGAFTHTARVDTAADTLATVFREARYYAMNNNVSVVPVILRDRKGNFTIVYAAKALTFHGKLNDTDKAPLTFAPAVAGASDNPWSLVRQSLDGAQLEKGAFVFMVGSPTLDLNNLGSPQAYYEMMYMKVTPPSDPALQGDSSQYQYEILGRGIHNTRLGQFDSATTNYGGAAGYVVVSGSHYPAQFADEDAMRDFTLDGFHLPSQVVVDQVPRADDPATRDERVAATITSQAGAFHEDGQYATSNGGNYPGSTAYPVFLPVFQPNGRVTTAAVRNTLGGVSLGRNSAYPDRFRFADHTLRVFDTVTHETRFITIRSANGQVFIGNQKPLDALGNDGVPAYTTIYDPTSTTASSSNSTTSNSTSTSTGQATSTSSTASSSNSTSNSTSNSSSTSTGQATTATSSSSNSSSNSSTSSASNSSTNSSSTSNSSSSSNSTASTGTASTSSTSNSSSASSSNSSSASSSAASSASSSNSSASSSNSTSTTSGAPPGGGRTSASGGTGSGDGEGN